MTKDDITKLQRETVGEAAIAEVFGTGPSAEKMLATLREIGLKANDERLPPRVALWAIAQLVRQTGVR